jgi:hypothetical protein
LVDWGLGTGLIWVEVFLEKQSSVISHLVLLADISPPRRKERKEELKPGVCGWTVDEWRITIG